MTADEREICIEYRNSIIDFTRIEQKCLNYPWSPEMHRASHRVRKAAEAFDNLLAAEDPRWGR